LVNTRLPRGDQVRATIKKTLDRNRAHLLETLLPALTAIPRSSSASSYTAFTRAA